MIREKVKVEEFYNIAKKHDYFLWHFVQKNQVKNKLTYYSYFDEPTEERNNSHELRYVLDKIDIPYYESYTEESIDFLLNYNFNPKILFNPTFIPDLYIEREFFYSPLIIGFRKFSYVYSTLDICYCLEGLLEILMRMNPKFITDMYLD